MSLKRMVGTAVCLAVMLMSGYASAQQKAKEDKIMPDMAIKAHKIIRIEDAGIVTPDAITVEPGTTVIWINNAKRAMEISFEGKQVTLACKSPVHFVIDEQGSFLSNRIPSGSVASLCFIEKGEFSYVARNVLSSYAAGVPYEDRPRECKGKVIVK